MRRSTVPPTTSRTRHRCWCCGERDKIDFLSYRDIGKLQLPYTHAFIRCTKCGAKVDCGKRPGESAREAENRLVAAWNRLSLTMIVKATTTQTQSDHPRT